MTNITEQDTESTASQAKKKAKDTVGETAQQVQEKAQDVKGQASGRLRQEVDSRSTEAGSQLQSTAQAMRSTSEQLRDEGKEAPAKVAEAVAQRAERLGGYLTGADADRILRDVEDVARRQPWLVAFGGAALGFLAARFLKASSGRRYESVNGASSWQQRELPAYSTAANPAQTYEPAGGGGSVGSSDR
jgi:ElaB/YqjD/DUF883 family membrane-anchored ribosome-binding protein